MQSSNKPLPKPMLKQIMSLHGVTRQHEFNMEGNTTPALWVSSSLHDMKKDLLDILREYS